MFDVSYFASSRSLKSYVLKNKNKIGSEGGRKNKLFKEMFDVYLVKYTNEKLSSLNCIHSRDAENSVFKIFTRIFHKFLKYYSTL